MGKPNRPEQKPKQQTNTVRNFRLGQMAISLGLNFALWSFAGYFLGNKLDERFGTAPWLMLTGILLGIGFTFYGFIKEILLLGELDKKNASAKKDSKRG